MNKIHNSPFMENNWKKIIKRKLGPEFISYRPGWNGIKIAYLEGWMAINLANKIFGNDGWSSEIKQITTDYCDFIDGKFNIGVTCHLKVTLKNGNFHEDVGFGTAENQKSKGTAFEKAKKEAATDALKRALRQFGNLLGNCCYDREYIKQIKNVKKTMKSNFNENNLFRINELDDELNFTESECFISSDCDLNESRN